jgi:hypothetical protein
MGASCGRINTPPAVFHNVGLRNDHVRAHRILQNEYLPCAALVVDVARCG